MSLESIHDTLRRLFAAVPTMSIATVDDAGRPHAANVNFVADTQVNLYFVSHPDSAHSRHLAAHPHVAATAYAPFTSPAEIRGVQLHGTCAPIHRDYFNAVWTLFCRRFEYARQFEEHVRREQFYCLVPTWVRYIDNARGFGAKIETDWPPT